MGAGWWAQQGFGGPACQGNVYLLIEFAQGVYSSGYFRLVVLEHAKYVYTPSSPGYVCKL